MRKIARKYYSLEFKLYVIEQVNKRKNISEISIENNISRATIYKWLGEEKEIRNEYKKINNFIKK